jgi:hypothetical protein
MSDSGKGKGISGLSDAPSSKLLADSSSLTTGLKLSGIKLLKAPGAESNYIDWSFVLELFLEHSKVSYVLSLMTVAARPASWAENNLAVCSVITRNIVPANYQLIRPHRRDASGMWASLKSAHEDSSAGGRMYWIRQLVKAKMVGSNVRAHISRMGGFAEILNALITADRPLSADDILSTALLILLPNNWLPCVSALMNEEGVTSSCVIAALKAEELRRMSRSNDPSNPITVSKADASPSSSHPSSEGKLFCTFCKCTGHNLNACNNLAALIKDHKAKCHRKYLACQGQSTSPSKLKSSTKFPLAMSAQAGSVSVVKFGGTSDDNDFSGSEVNIYASPAVASLLSRISSPNGKDFNLNLGCSMSMTLFLDTVEKAIESTTPICLADKTVVNSTHRGTSSLPLGFKY